YYNPFNGSYLYTTTDEERAFISEFVPTLVSEGPQFRVSNFQAPDMDPVYRFYEPKTGVHFFTSSESERDFVENNIPDYQLIGVAWFAESI
ncbi:MAG: serine protease, partial [Pseudomonadota bacterium]